MKKTNTIYWIVISLFSAFMVFVSVPEIQNNADAVKFFANLGFPAYMNPFLGIAKILGVIAILIPGFTRIKEWAYAGLMFDLLGATYAGVATAGLLPQELFMLLPISLLVISYVLYHKRLKAGI